MINYDSCCIYVTNQAKFIETRPNHSKINLTAKYLGKSGDNCRERKKMF